MLKIPFAIIFVVVLIFSSYYFITNIGKTNFDYEEFGGCPWDANNLPWFNNDFPWTKNLNIDNIYNSWGGSHEFKDIGQINQDYWFTENTINTKTGWTFTISKAKDCDFKAIVLDYYVYNKDNTIYEAVELFSPVDILFGYDDIVDNPENYPYQIISHFYRGVFYRCVGTSSYCTYFSSHFSNTHIIPHNQDVYNKLLSINVGDVISLSGSYVNIYGSDSSENTQYSWTTDTVIGNSHCEIILVDSLEFS
jgi:hypothetical protein